MVCFRAVARVATVAVLAAAVVSCGPKGPPLYPVTGQVLFEGQPPDGAMITFHPVRPDPENRLPGATVGADGSFTLNTFPYGAGAPEGEYVVLLSWLQSAGGDQVRNRLPARYAQADKSPLKATVKPGPNALEPFRLTKAP